MRTEEEIRDKMIEIEEEAMKKLKSKGTFWSNKTQYWLRALKWVLSE